MLGFSALQRAENSSMIRPPARPEDFQGFSALQRAENSSIIDRHCCLPSVARFQCSSASRKFLNYTVLPLQPAYDESFSALQRAENSSIVIRHRPDVLQVHAVSVLFSEPKIPQSYTARPAARAAGAFQCSSASRKFLNVGSHALNDNG